jgi:hypothetical protein
MRRLWGIALCLVLLLAAPGAAQAEFGFQALDQTFTAADGSPSTQAASHPFAVSTRIDLNATFAEGEELPDDAIKDLTVSLPPGLIGAPSALARCSGADFTSLTGTLPNCPDASAVGIALTKVGITEVKEGEKPQTYGFPVWNLVPPPGVPLRIGFVALGVPVTINLGLSPNPPYNAVASLPDIPQAVRLYGSTLTVWGDPVSSAHDSLRGHCLKGDGTSIGKECSADIAERAFITLPSACEGPLPTSFEADSWQDPGVFLSETIFTHDDSEPPNPLGITGCSRPGFSPAISAKPTSKAASSPTGLDFSLDVQDEGLENPEGIAQSTIREARVTLPEGMSANPSIAEGLAVCTEAELEAESASSAPGEGCPNASKVGSVTVESPLVEEPINGALYIAKPYENPFDTLLALYIVIKNPTLGVIVRQALRVEPDPVTGQLTTVAEELPQIPFSHFKLHFREGARSPLTTPQACGTYQAQAELTPWSGNAPITTNSAFEIITGPNEGPCPSGGLPPFKPGLIAGTNNNRAGSFSPFYLRLFRSDAEQEITHFSIKLPPGITGKLAGIPYCSDQQIEAAKARTGPHGGQEELDSPSCPAASEIGRTLAGAGVGPSLTYAPGKVYLAGPYNGSNLSMVAITAGRVGPFDIGTVVVREGFKINPETAEVFIDSTGSDPIPHIIRGIPVHLRDIRAYVDRPEFVLNPTDCSPTSTASTVLGSGLDFVSEADDNPITVASRFQAADCAALTFAPRLSFKLIGGTKRGKFPKLVSHLSMNGIGESGIGSAQVILPHSEFIENAHFVNICTRVQFKEGAGNGSSCPAGSIYGHARAVTPILSEPLEGPVMLRSNPERKLPDVVAALHNSQVDFDLVGNVDSVKGQLRTTFATAPDAPVTSFDLELEGGSKGLFVNSTDLCLKKQHVNVAFAGQNGKQFTTKPVMAVKCKGKARKHRRHHKRGRR